MQRAPIHVCYVLSTNGEPYYGDLLAVSAKAVRRLYNDARLTIVTDEQSLHFAQRLADQLAASVRSAGTYRADARARSRFVKTQVRNLIDGDFLYLDADTLPVARFDELFACDAPIGAALDRHATNPSGSFPPDHAGYFQTMGWPHPAPFYLNGGVMFWRDCPMARQLGRSWHANWRKFFATIHNPLDQAALSHSITSLGVTPAIVDNRFNLWPGLLVGLADDARIYHFHDHGGETLEGTIVDRLIEAYRETGEIESSLIEAAARRRHPWLVEPATRIIARAAAQAVVTPRTIDQLPAAPSIERLSVEWDGIEGLAVRPVEVAAATKATPLLLTATPTMGRHRLGIKARGIDVGRVHRVLIWLQAESAVNLYLDLRDDLGARSGKASFKLHHAAAYYADPDIVAFGVSPAANGWTRVWADMKFAGEAVVVYLSLANSRGNTEFAGIGTTGMIFGGIDIAKRELTPP